MGKPGLGGIRLDGSERAADDIGSGVAPAALLGQDAPPLAGTGLTVEQAEHVAGDLGKARAAALFGSLARDTLSALTRTSASGSSCLSQIR